MPRAKWSPDRVSGRRPVGLLPRVLRVVGESTGLVVPIEDLVEREFAWERARRADVPAELVAEHLDQALHEQAFTGRERALLAVGGASRADQDELDVSRLRQLIPSPAGWC